MAGIEDLPFPNSTNPLDTELIRDANSLLPDTTQVVNGIGGSSAPQSEEQVAVATLSFEKDLQLASDKSQGKVQKGIDNLTGLQVLSAASASSAEIDLEGLPPSLLGDADGDGDTDSDDLTNILKARKTLAIGIDDMRDIDGNGRIDLFDVRRLALQVRRNSDKSGPNLIVNLSTDTGLETDDGITSSLNVQGAVTDTSEITRFYAGFDDTPVEQYKSVFGVLGNDGSFALTQNQLAQIYGETLEDGPYSLFLQAKDRWGNISETVEVSFVLDTSAPIFDITSLGDSALLKSGSRLQGTVSEAFGIASLSYRFNDLPDVSFAVNAVGEFDTELDVTAIDNGSHTLTVTATDLAGNVQSSSFTVELDKIAPVIVAELVNDTGLDNSDALTSDPKIAGTVTDVGQVAELQASLNNNSFVDISDVLQPDGTYSLEADTFKLINADVELADGFYRLNLIAIDAAGNSSEVSTVEFNLDTTAPTPFVGDVTESDTMLDVLFDEAVTAEAFDEESYRLTVASGDNAGTTIEITGAEKISDSGVQLSLSAPLSVNSGYTLTVIAAIQDLAGNTIAANTNVDISVDPPTVELAPIHGEERVALNRKTVIRFEKEIDPSTVTEDTVYLIANGGRLPGRLEVSSTNKFVTFIPENPLPASTEVRVVVKGDEIKTPSGVALDGDLDGNAGGDATADFTTVPLTQIEGTNLFGYVYDSYNRNPDGSNKPLAGVTIRVDGLPDVFAVTDETGYFKLVDLPAPDVYVFIDGSTATGAPTGAQYASLGKPFHTLPGQEIQLKMDGEPFDIYLPPMTIADVETLSATEDTDVGFGAGALALLQQALPDVDASVWEAVKVTFPAGAARDDAGSAATQAMIVPVEVDRLPAPLPPNLDPKLVISVQAGGENGFNREVEGGSTYFDVPAPIQFPNLDGLAPGEKATFWSFDHEAGHWVSIGLGTVSEDGKTIESDPGVGILAPGWHFVSPPLVLAGSGDPPTTPAPNPDPSPEISIDFESNKPIKRTYSPPLTSSDLPRSIPQPRASSRHKSYEKIIVKTYGEFESFWELDGDINKEGSYVLRPGDKPLQFSAKPLSSQGILNKINNGLPLQQDVILGGRVSITRITTHSNGSSTSTEEILAYRYLDQLDDNSNDSVLKFIDTLAAKNIVRTRDIDFRIGDAPPVSLVFLNQKSSLDDFKFDKNKKQLQFSPSSIGEKGTGLFLQTDFSGRTVTSNNFLVLSGEGVSQNSISFNRNGLENALERLSNNIGKNQFPKFRAGGKRIADRVEITDNELELFDTPGERAKIANDTEVRFRQLFLPFQDAITYKLDGEDAAIVWKTENNDELGDSENNDPAFDSGIDDNERITKAIKVALSNGHVFQDGEYRTSNPEFMLAQALNTKMKPLVSVIVNEHLEKNLAAPYELTSIQLSNYLAETAAHEIGHTFGLSHTSEFSSEENSEVQEIVISPGTNNSPFRLNFNDQVTEDIPINSNDLVILSALRKIYTVGSTKNISVTKTRNGVFEVAFFDQLGGQDLPPIKALGNNRVTIREKSNGSTTAKLSKGIDAASSLLDVMKSTSPPDLLGTASFASGISKEILLLALKLGWSKAQSKSALESYLTHHLFKIDEENKKSKENLTEANPSTVESQISGKVLGLHDHANRYVGSNISFNSFFQEPSVEFTVDDEYVQTLFLSNLGDEPVKIDDIEILSVENKFSLQSQIKSQEILPGDKLPVEISFQSDSVGQFDGKLVILSEHELNPRLEFGIHAISKSNSPSISYGFKDGVNNLSASNGVKDITKEFEITNNGIEDLIFSSVISHAKSSFELGIVEGLEYTLASGESISIPVTFTPSSTGLQPGTITFTTNDPDQPTITQGLIGTGLPEGPTDFDWGNDFVTITYNDFTQRLVSNDAGNFSFDLPTRTEYEISIFDPVSGLIAKGGGFTGAAGAFTDLTSSLSFRASEAPDTDFDGLPDDIEFAIGTDHTKADTDGDDLSDFTEIENGLDPLGGQGYPTGIIAALPLFGEAKGIVVEAANTNERDQVAYVATGSHGLAIVDASEFNNPIILGQLDLAGDATDVAVNTTLNIAAIASNDGGLHLVDISDPMLPVLRQTVDINAREVEIVEGIAYVAVDRTSSSGNLTTIDLLSGEEIQSIRVGGIGNITDIAHRGNHLYTYTNDADNLSVIDISDPLAANVIGQTRVSISSNQVGISVLNDIIYLAGSGLRTVDVSDPTNPVQIGDVQGNNFFIAKDLSPNGSGLVLTASGTDGVPIYREDITDPANPNNFVNRIDTPGTAEDLVIASGIAYVADGSGGLQVINYLPFDTAGQAPTISISTDAQDADDTQSGLQVFRGSSVPVILNVQDDTQVRNVELLVNGTVVRNDVSFPFDLTVTALGASENDTTVDIQVRATDTGGNRTLSNQLTLDLVDDTVAPTVTSVSPSDGATKTVLPGISIYFNEAISAEALDASGITLIYLGDDKQLGGNDDVVQTVSFQLSFSGESLFIIPDDLDNMPEGNYQLELDPSVIEDRAGNSLATAFTLNFAKQAQDQALPLGEAIQGTLIDPGEFRTYDFAATAGQQFYIGATLSPGTNIKLLDPDGNEIYSRFNFQNRSVNVSDIQELATTGSYQILFESDTGDKDYTLLVIDLPQATPLALDTEIETSFDFPWDHELYQFDANQNQKIFLLDALNGEPDTGYDIFGPNNQLLVSSSFSPNIERFLGSAGTYYLAVHGRENYLFGDNSRDNLDYSFKIFTPEITSTPLVIGNRVTDQIGEPGEIDIYTFNAQAGQRLYYDGISGTANTRLALANSFFPTNLLNGFSPVDAPITINTAGPYELTLDTSGSETSGYSFQILDVSTNATNISFDTQINRALSFRGETQLFTFNGNAGQRIFLNALGTQTDGNFYLFGPRDQLIGSTRIDTDTDFVLPEAGVYLLAAESFAENSILEYGFEISAA